MPKRKIKAFAYGMWGLFGGVDKLREDENKKKREEERIEVGNQSLPTVYINA